MGSLAAMVAMATHSELWQMYLAILRGYSERRGEERVPIFQYLAV